MHAQAPLRAPLQPSPLGKPSPPPKEQSLERANLTTNPPLRRVVVPPIARPDLLFSARLPSKPPAVHLNCRQPRPLPHPLELGVLVGSCGAPIERSLELAFPCHYERLRCCHPPPLHSSTPPP
eukprot:1188454-Prorocentrum_minimum.AAC.7